MDISNDWELLPTDHSDPLSPVSFDDFDSVPLVQLNYFSLDAPRDAFLDDDDKSADSDNPSWIDPALHDTPNRYLNKDSGEFWSDSSSEPSQLGELYGNDLCSPEIEKREMIIGEVIEKKGENSGNLSSEIGSSSAKLGDFVEKSEKGAVNLHKESDVLVEGKNGSENTDDEGGNKKSGGGELGKRSFVWWKMPMEFLKYFVFRMSPVWTVSVAAAAMGFVILGRRLYTMKKKTMGLQIKVTVDDKKVSQVMSRAARLNEAFSVVKRVPVIRPSLPAIGVTPWPVMSLR